ncbi:unnamed protein product [Acanthoscelides obtectus]|uniref:Uncharacterized protein n=1 Tax=Acanthoscelides obtectus TaxID=200917 RepID=A0A9P0LSX0_ACAOB|nr:unnamed protein product [Acanthoscelides obtectus]CAK1650709.1 hypothetical protein AOBTE_LOCUS16876 [Acanthoscelides obtectus]
MIIIEHHLLKVDSRDLACSSTCISLVVAELSKRRALLRLLRQ